MTPENAPPATAQAAPSARARPPDPPRGGRMDAPAVGALLAPAAAGHGQFGRHDSRVQLAGCPALAAFFASAIALAVTAPAGDPYAAALRLGGLRFFGKYSCGIYVFYMMVPRRGPAPRRAGPGHRPGLRRGPGAHGGHYQ